MERRCQICRDQGHVYTQILNYLYFPGLSLVMDVLAVIHSSFPSENLMLQTTKKFAPRKLFDQLLTFILLSILQLSDHVLLGFTRRKWLTISFVWQLRPHLSADQDARMLIPLVNQLSMNVSWHRALQEGRNARLGWILAQQEFTGGPFSQLTVAHV